MEEDAKEIWGGTSCTRCFFIFHFPVIRKHLKIYVACSRVILRKCGLYKIQADGKGSLSLRYSKQMASKVVVLVAIYLALTLDIDRNVLLSRAASS